MEEADRSQRMQISKMIEEKLTSVSDLRATLEHKRKILSNSVDDQILLAEIEYRLVREEMALLSLQEEHWESAALWDTPEVPEVENEVCEVLHSYIMSVKEKGAIPALHATEHLALENGILISSQGDKPSVPVVEWAHEATELQTGDRLLEVNGRSVIGKDSNEVTQLLSSTPVCRVVFLRPLSTYQLLKNVGCKEASNLRQELTSVVSRLNHKMADNTLLKEQAQRLKNDLEELKTKNQKLKLQIISLQNILLFFYQLIEQNVPDSSMETIKNVLVTNSVNGSKLPLTCSTQNGKQLPVLHPSVIREIINATTKSIPWYQLIPNISKCDSEQHPAQEQSAEAEITPAEGSAR